MSAGEEHEKRLLMEHFAELRRRFMIAAGTFLGAVAVCYYFAPEIYAFLVQPLANSFQEGETRRLIYTGLAEAFFTYLKLAMFGGVVLAFPVMAAQVYYFVAPGLYTNERRVMVPYLVAAPLLFLAGAALCYFWVFPMAWHFFLSFEQAAHAGGLPIQLEARVSEYLSLTMHMVLAFGLAFQLPLVLLLLVRGGLVEARTLARGRRFAMVAIAVFSAIITPPDVISMLSLMVPLYALYEASVWLCVRQATSHQ